MDYTTYLHQYKTLYDSNVIVPWNGALYLPPCSCRDNLKCAEATNADQYDFSKHADLRREQLVDLCKYIEPLVDDYTLKSYIFCNKYSLRYSHDDLPLHWSKPQRIMSIKNSVEYKTKRKLLQNDLKLLFPLSGSLFVFKTRDTKHCCKFDILCNMKFAYHPTSKNKSTKGITRQCKTSKSISRDTTCKFQISVFLDITTLEWYIKRRGNKTHTHHNFKEVNVASIGMSQLSNSMVTEINKLHKSSVSSSIQQNILMTNNDISVPIMTILNQQYSQEKLTRRNKTDFEELLDLLRSRHDITYFVMYAKSLNTPLLTVRKTSSARKAINNNVAIQGYVRVYQQAEESLIPPQFDSHQQKIVKELLRTNSETNEVEIILAVGWARDTELCLFRKFPEVIKMDCTHSTNREERPLFNLVGKDSNNRLYNIMRCLLPSEKGAIFHTLLSNIIPKILGSDTCQQVNIIITDGDSQEIKAAQKA